jgi:predicted deacetylase
MTGIVSIHDLMPETMARVEAILDWLRAHGQPKVTLLVVPGKPWSQRGIGRLRDLAAEGHALAAHGWHHQTSIRRWKHRIHARLISRNVAEHLDLDATGITRLMQRSHDWFAKQQLPSPSLYVPPAWALGAITPGQLADLPYEQIETTRGLYQRGAADTFCKHTYPLTGYEADTPFRASFLRRWNNHQARSAQRSGRPLRISIHPDDLRLRLTDQLANQLRAVDRFIHYSALLEQNPEA